MISTLFNVAPDAVSLLEILGSACRFSVDEHIPYLFRYIRFRQYVCRRSMEKREAEMRIGILEEPPLLFRRVLFAF